MSRRTDREMNGSTLWDLGPFELLLQRKLGGEASQHVIRPVSRLIAMSEEDAARAARLLALPRAERLELIEKDPAFQHESLARFFILRAEASLLAGSYDLESAELGAVVAISIDPVPGASVERTAALAFWLLGKCCLALRRRQDAENAFEMMNAFLPAATSDEHAMSMTGLAQLRYDQGAWQDAAMLFGRAAAVFTRLGAAEPAAACRAQQGLLLAEMDDHAKARAALCRALEDLDQASAPSLSGRLLLTLAQCEASLGEGKAARQALLEARQLYDLPAAPGEELARAWLEARVAGAMGQHAAAERLLDPVRRELLAAGSMGEAAAATLDLIVLRLRAGRPGAQDLAGAFIEAFPLAPERFLQHLEELATPGAPAGGELAGAADLRRRLQKVGAEPGDRPARLVASRALADRLLRRIGEHEDPLGAAQGL